MPTSEETRNREVVQAYYAAIAHGATSLEWEGWFAPDVLQEEFPNRLLPHGARRDLQTPGGGEDVMPVAADRLVFRRTQARRDRGTLAVRRYSQYGLDHHPAGARGRSDPAGYARRG